MTLVFLRLADEETIICCPKASPDFLGIHRKELMINDNNNYLSFVPMYT